MTIEQFVKAAQELTLTDEQTNTTGIVVMVCETQGPLEEGKQGAKLNLIIQGKGEIIIGGLSKSMEQDADVYKVFRKAVKNCHSNPMDKFVEMIELLSQMEKESESKEESKD